MSMRIKSKDLRRNQKNKNTYVPELFDKSSYLTKITLKKPLSRGSRFKIYFRLEYRGNRGSRLSFHVTSFQRFVN